MTGRAQVMYLRAWCGLIDMFCPCGRNRRRKFIAFLFEALAISASVCFHDVSKASTKEVHMKISSTIGQKSMLCASAAADIRALLG